MVKDSALSLLWLRFDPWPGNFCMPWAGPEKKERERERESERERHSLGERSGANIAKCLNLRHGDAGV